MKKAVLYLLLVALVAVLSWGKVGDIHLVIKTPGPCPIGLAFDGQSL